MMGSLMCNTPVVVCFNFLMYKHAKLLLELTQFSGEK